MEICSSMSMLVLGFFFHDDCKLCLCCKCRNLFLKLQENMAKSIKFDVILNVDGKEHLVTATTDAKNLRDAVVFVFVCIAMGFQPDYVRLTEAHQVPRQRGEGVAHFAENPHKPLFAGISRCDSAGIQTLDLQNRNLTLYSAKLRNRFSAAKVRRREQNTKRKRDFLSLH